MAEALINSTESNTLPNGVSDPLAPAPSGSLFHRRIEFRPARKPFTGFSIGSGDFRLETLNPGSKPQRPGSNQGSGPLALAGKKPDGSEFVENGLDPELSFGITFRRIGAGLENLGNTCFLNSVLQCLTYTEPLAAYLQSGKHQTSCRTAGFCALCAIQKHVSRALQSTGRILAPKDLVSNLRCISRTFRNSRQEDAHEYMVNLLESMHKCCLPSGVPSESPSAYEKSLVHKIFGGSLRSQVKCMQCSFCSNKFDPFLDLSLEIVKAESLYKALAHFTAKEQLDGGERHYQCQQCKQKVKALKQLTIHKAPYVLTIHLKRFGSHVPGQKIDKKIPFGPTLDLKPFVTGPYDGDLKYTLYGVLVHAGWSTHSGHYYCFVRTSSGMWYSLDDNQVVQVNERKVLEQKAYMLFYVRDRGNFASKKPVDVAKKENMVISSVGRNKVYSNFNQGSKETNQNGPIDKRLNGPNSAGASKETAMKEESNQKINGLMMAKRSALNKEHLLEHSSKLLPLKNSVKSLSGECLPKSVSSVKASHDTLKLDNAVTKMTAAKFAEFGVDTSTKKDPCDSVSRSLNCTEDRSTKKDTIDSVTIPLNHIIPHQSSGDICKTETTSTTSSGKNGNNASSLDFSERKISTVMSVCRASRDVSQTGGFSEERTIDSVSAELSSLPIKTCISLPKKALDPKPHQKMSKKLLKRQVTSMHLSSSILFGSSLIMRKKKHKRSKQCALGIKNLSRKHFLNGDFVPTDLEPSTSEKFGTMPLGGSAHSRRKGVDSGSKKKDKSSLIKNVGTNSNGDLLMGVIDKEVRERIGQNDAMIAAEDRPQKSSTATASVGNQLDDRGSNGLKDSRRGSMQNGLMNMLTRGLEDTIVARWDERELYPARMTEASGVESVSIGYVADEWDEELDRGKRKKVRTSNNIFGGPNPFQEIATTKAKLKKAKTDRSSSGNQPFRL